MKRNATEKKKGPLSNNHCCLTGHPMPPGQETIKEAGTNDFKGVAKKKKSRPGKKYSSLPNNSKCAKRGGKGPQNLQRGTELSNVKRPESKKKKGKNRTPEGPTQSGGGNQKG